MLLSDESPSEEQGGSAMSEQDPKGGYGRNWGKYILIYLLIGGAVYLLVWLLFFRGGGLYG
jgi:hypothetical protein